jgi:hypothetical protein
MELEVFAGSQDSNMESEQSTGWNSEEVDLVKGKHATRESTNKKPRVMKDEGYSVWTARQQCEGSTDAILNIIMQLPEHTNYLLCPPHLS